MRGHRSLRWPPNRAVALALGLAVLCGTGTALMGTGKERADGAGHGTGAARHRSPAVPASRPSSPARTSTATPTAGAPSAVELPPADAGLDYQLGGAYSVPRGVGVVSRDREDPPASGVYSICYVNAFQTQPGDTSWWKSEHPDLLLRGTSGYVVDPEWDEILLDISTDARRQALMRIVGPWIDGCAADGFDAVEPDNLDSWTRSASLLARAQATAFARLLVERAHAAGLAIGQKNALELGRAARTDIGFDFAVAESCADHEASEGVPECQGFREVYGDRVLVIEYDDEHFELACDRFGRSLSIVRRDLDLETPGSEDYVFETC